MFKKFIKSTKSLWFCYTKSSRKNCREYIPVSVETEINLFQKRLKHHPNRAELLTQHVWSKEFRLWMFKQNMFELFAQVSSDEEVKVLLQQRTNIMLMEKVLRKQTPSLKLLGSLDYSDGYIKELVMRVPLAFAEAPIEVIIEHKDVCEILIKTFIERSWYKALNDYLVAIVKAKKNYEDIVLAIAQKTINGKTFAEVWPLIKSNYPHVYVWIRENVKKLSNVTDVLKVGFIPGDLPSNISLDISNISNIKIDGALSKAEDSMAWFRLVFEDSKNFADVFDILVASFDDIKRMNVKLYEQLCSKLATYGNYANFKFASKATPEAKMIYLRLKNDTMAIWSFYPFEGWPDDYKKEALDMLAQKSCISYASLQMLPEDMRAYTLGRMEIYAQINTIIKGNVDDVQALYSKKLPQEVEDVVAKAVDEDFRSDIMTIPMKLIYANLAEKYMVLHHVSPSTFEVFLLRRNEKQIREFIQKRKGFLSQDEYNVLLGSRYKFLAPNVKLVENK